MRSTMSRNSNERRKQGFTLMEMLIVVAVIAVLIAVAIPVFSSSLHKSRVATDWANVKSYYNEIQTDYTFTDKYNPKVPIDWHTNPNYNWKMLTSLSGEKVPMKTGMCAVNFEESNGYSITYQCNAGHSQCEFEVGVQKSDS